MDGIGTKVKQQLGYAELEVRDAENRVAFLRDKALDALKAVAKDV